jgi:hypothetical protein
MINIGGKIESVEGFMIGSIKEDETPQGVE